MKTRRIDYSGLLPGRSSRRKAPEEWENDSDLIPIDLIYDILVRLPVKSLARFRCVSHFCSSVLRRQDFRNLFLKRSLDHPRLIFACERDRNNLNYFSAIQPEDPDVNYGPVIASHHMSMPFDFELFPLCDRSPVHGLICVNQQRFSNGRKETRLMVHNLSTGQSLLLPRVRTKRLGVTCYLAYDPLEEKHKILAMTYKRHGRPQAFEEIQVLTVGTRHWRMLECDTQHFSQEYGVCINGVLYYIAAFGEHEPDIMVVCFDVRTETFKFIKLRSETRVGHGTLINYNGVLASLTSNYICFLNHASTSIDLWVLEDFEKQEWSKRTLFFPALWNEVVGNIGESNFIHFAGVTRTNEIVLHYDNIAAPFYLFYYHIERNTIRRVEIQGMEAFVGARVVSIGLHHVEDLKLL